MNGISYNQMVMRVRKVSDDRNADLCPSLVGTEPWWANTIGHFPHSRAVGQTIMWNCIDELYFEGMEGSTTRTSNGISTCIQTGTAPPVWSPSEVTLPCTRELELKLYILQYFILTSILVVCPDQFEESEDGTTCFHFSTAPTSDYFAATVAYVHIFS